MRKACPRCSGAVQQKSLGRLAAEDAPLKLAVEIDGDFMLWLIQELKQRGAALPAGEEKGTIFRKYLCGACGKELASKSEHRQSSPVDLAYPGYPAFKAEIEMPVYKCTGCGKEQVRSVKEVQKHTSMAIAGLNDAAGFPHV